MEEAHWSSIVSSLASRDLNTCLEAATRLHAEASLEDVPRLVDLLKSDDFFVREAAAWPLAELAGPSVLTELFVAYQRGFDDGHDNDGFTAALLEVPALFPNETRQVLEQVIVSSEEPVKGHASWLITFCPVGNGGDA